MVRFTLFFITVDTSMLPLKYGKVILSNHLAVLKSGIVDSLLSWANFKLSKDLKKSDVTKTEKIHGIEKVDNANKAGGKESDKCTLILTEGDSAKAVAVSCVIVQSILALTLSLLGFTLYDF